MSADHRLLLKEAALLYEMHEARRPRPSFNVFSVLRTESDEVNLHSRFLHALLDYKKPVGENKENLTDFLGHVGVKDFEQRGIRVERERDNIDILITNDDKQAVVIENKIWAGDQPEQLLRYHATLTEQGYGRIHLLYLTLDGHDPAEDSAGGLPYETMSYRDTLSPWLERCQQRAYDEPELRESVAQYRQLIRKLTGTDTGRAYMNELTELCLQDNNLLLIHDLHEAWVEAKVCLLQKLWCEIDTALKTEIVDLPTIDKASACAYHASEENIRGFVTARRGYKYHGLCYSISEHAWLGVVTDNGILFGVYCEKENQAERVELEKALRNVDNGSSSDWWPWYRKADGLNLALREDLKQLSSKADREALASQIARDLKPVWEAIKGNGPSNHDE